MIQPNLPPNSEPVAQIEKLMSTLLVMPRAWLLSVSGAILLSLFEGTRTADGAFVVSFHFTAITAGLIALIWLPSLLKIIALNGGGLKTPLGEATAGGMTEILRIVNTSAQAIAALDVAERVTSGPDQKIMRNMREELERQVATLPIDIRQARQEIMSYARDYEDLRRTLPPGGDRTFRMETVWAKARALAHQARYTPSEIRSLFEEGSEGERLVSLALLEAVPDAANFDLVLEAISKSRSGFEQYRALLAAEAMLPLLNATQKQQLKQALLSQRNGKPRSYINPDTDRWQLSTRILHALDTASSTA
jgi:hypothetical protein